MNGDVYKVLTVGGARGDITLYGYRFEDKFFYSLRTAEVLLDEFTEDTEEKSSTAYQLIDDYVEGWEPGRKLLELYPWRRLYPVYLNPAYKERIIASYLQGRPKLSRRWEKFFKKN